MDKICSDDGVVWDLDTIQSEVGAYGMKLYLLIIEQIRT